MTMTTPNDVEFRIMPNGDGGGRYWEVIRSKHVVARGVAETEPTACAAAYHAAREANLVKEEKAETNRASDNAK
jgi:hypothetical protein